MWQSPKTTQGVSSDGFVLSAQFELRAVSSQLLQVQYRRVRWRQRYEGNLISKGKDLHHDRCRRLLLTTEPLFGNENLVDWTTCSAGSRDCIPGQDQNSRCRRTPREFKERVGRRSKQTGKDVQPREYPVLLSPRSARLDQHGYLARVYRHIV